MDIYVNYSYNTVTLHRKLQKFILTQKNLLLVVVMMMMKLRLRSLKLKKRRKK